MMTVLEIVQALSKNTGADEPAVAVSGTTPDVREAVHFTEMVCEELSRRFDWPALEKTTTLTGTGASTIFNLPTDLLHMGPVTIANAPLRGALAPGEWSLLAPVSGAPRFFYLKDRQVEFWPYPANGLAIKVVYQSEHWNTTASKWLADSNIALVPDHLIFQGALWRWRRHKGQEYADYMSEYEAALTHYSAFSREERSP